MAKRKLTGPRRSWSLDEIELVRRLRDEDGKTFTEIGLAVGAPGHKCRVVYHTGRYADKQGQLTIGDVCEELGVSRHRYHQRRHVLQQRQLPSGTEDVRAELIRRGYGQ